jgi:hypothetical protein
MPLPLAGEESCEAAGEGLNLITLIRLSGTFSQNWEKGKISIILSF